MVSSEPIVIPAPKVEPAAPVTGPSPAAAAPSATSVQTAPPPAAVPVSAAAVKPNTIYRIQVGSYKEVRNALSTAERLKNAGLDPVYERNGELFRVVLSGIPSEEVNNVLQKIGNAGFENPLLREEH
jgi:rare lipoprotein A